MVAVNSEMEKALVSYLEVKELDSKTKKIYIEFYRKYCNIYNEINTKNIDNFLKHNRNRPARAMIKNLLKAILRWNFPQEIKVSVAQIDVPKITGKKGKKLPKHITREEIQMLSDRIPKDNPLVDGRTRIMILVQFWAGLRVEELMGLRLKDLLLDNYNPDDKFQYIIIRSESAKFKQERKAYVPTFVYKMLIEWLKMNINYLSERGKKFEEDSKIWGIGARRYMQLLEKWSYRILGIKYNSHSLRHGRGTDLIKNEGWSIEEVKEYLGHLDIGSTQVYVHLADQDIKNKLEI